MEIKNSWLLLISIIVILTLTAYIFFGRQSETGYTLDPSYPRNLIEGSISSIEISPSEGKFKVKVNLNQIFQEEISSIREVIVLVDEDTEFLSFNLETKTETNIKIGDFEEGDLVVVATEEENTGILTQDIFTGMRVKKMVVPLESNI